MQRSRLKNIINKSKEISNKSKVVGDPFDEFKKSLPKELKIDDNYRLEAAWKAYGSPKDYKHALWEGLIQPIDEETYKLPSIGYNEDTDEYEYLNKGEDNETVAKDIRVWDNDVIPFVKELKHGGYIRKFNKEKDCWTYTKNSQKEDTLDQEQVNIPKEPSGEATTDYLKKGGKIKIKTIWDDYIEVDSISDDQRAGRVPIGRRNGQDLYLNGDGMAAPLNHTLGKNENGGIIDSFKQGGQMNVIPEGALHARKNNMELAEEGEVTHKGIPVVDNEGEQQAEVEKEEWTMSKELTEDVERWYKKYFNDNTPKMEREELAIKCGKRIVEELLHNTDDRAGLIQKMEEEL